MAVASHSRVRVAPNLYQRGDGVFVAGLSIDGKWTMKTLDARTKTEAKLQLARLRTDPPRSRAAVAAEREQLPTVDTVAAQFLVHFEAMVDSGERSPRTLDHYAWTLRDYILPAWSDWEPSRVGPDEVVALTQTLRGTGHGPSVLKAIEQTTSRFFNFAIRRGYAESNPVSKLERGERAKVNSDDRRVLTSDEIERLFSAAQTVTDLTVLALLLYAGLRQGEALGLRWSDIDFELGLIRLRLQLQRPRGGGPPTLGPLKMHSVRDVVLIPQLASLLREHRLASGNSLDGDYVFADIDGSPPHYSRANRILKRITKAAKVEKASMHTFRRTYTSHLIIEQGLDVVRVQRQLGHSRASVTSDRYAFLFEQARHADELRASIATSPYAALLVAGREAISRTQPG
jgi:integrase